MFDPYVTIGLAAPPYGPSTFGAPAYGPPTFGAPAYGIPTAPVPVGAPSDAGGSVSSLLWSLMGSPQTTAALGALLGAPSASPYPSLEGPAASDTPLDNGGFPEDEITKLSPKTAMESLRDNYSKLTDDSGHISQESLQKAVQDPSLSESVRRSAAKMLQHTFMFRAADGARTSPFGMPGGKEDGKVSKDDLERTLEMGVVPEEDRTDEARTHLTTLLNGFDTLEKVGANGKGKGSGDGVVGTPELEQIANDAGASPEMREAAKFMLDNPYYAFSADNALDKGQKDGKFVRGDVEAALAQLGGPPEVDLQPGMLTDVTA